MATSTTNISLTKPASNEAINLNTLNGNWDKIDTAIGAIGGTVSSTNNLMTKINSVMPGSMTGNSSTDFSGAVDGVTSANVTTDMKLRAKALLTAAETQIGNMSNNSAGTYYITAPYTASGASSASANDAMLVISRGGSNQYYSGIFVPMRSSMPFAFRRAATGRAVTFMI